jgi:hypothetical protein
MPDRDGAARVAAVLPAALAARTPDAVAPLLDRDVRWGGSEDTPETCTDRTQVLTFYAALLADGVHLEARDVRVDGDQVHLLVRVASPDGGVEQPTVITVRDGRIVDVLQPDG